MDSNHMGMNRTGIDMSPRQTKEMMHGMESIPADLEGGGALAAIKREYIQMADPVGSVPLPGSFKGAMVAVKDKLTGGHPEVLINKLGERLAFERSGVRLYDAFIAKCEALSQSQLGALFTPDDVRRFRNEESAHFMMLKGIIESIGADPTAQTPDADVAAVNSMGPMKVITDPRTTVAQSLQALLTVELVDNCAWELLIRLADDMGMDEMAGRFRQALQQEEEHLAHVKHWYEQLVIIESGGTGTRH